MVIVVTNTTFLSHGMVPSGQQNHCRNVKPLSVWQRLPGSLAVESRLAAQLHEPISI